MTEVHEDRFWSKVEPTGFCWNWIAGKSSGGYGAYMLDGMSRKAHRVAYELLVGSIPEGLVIDHLCFNRACVNPDHMDVVTLAENSRRSRGAYFWANKRACPQGHPYDTENTRIDERGRRNCRTCRNAQGRRYYQARKQAAMNNHKINSEAEVA